MNPLQEYEIMVHSNTIGEMEKICILVNLEKFTSYQKYNSIGDLDPSKYDMININFGLDHYNIPLMSSDKILEDIRTYWNKE